MTAFCLTCERTVDPERDAFGDPLPLCGCPEPAAVERTFNPVTGRFTEDEPEQEGNR